jgi:Transglutaminase-like superfamily
VARLGLAAEILATYARVRWLLPRRELPRAVAQLRERGRRRHELPHEPSTARYSDAVVRVLRLLPADSRCLVRALVLLAVLARRGVRTELVIGVSPGPSFAAHAWVEHRGLPLLPAGSAGDGRLVEL